MGVIFASEERDEEASVEAVLTSSVAENGDGVLAARWDVCTHPLGIKTSRKRTRDRRDVRIVCFIDCGNDGQNRSGCRYRNFLLFVKVPPRVSEKSSDPGRALRFPSKLYAVFGPDFAANLKKY